MPRFRTLPRALALGLALAACSRPGKEADADDHPAGAPAADTARAGRVVLTAAAERTAGIQVEPAEPAAAGGSPGAGLEVPGEVQIDSARVAVVSSRAPGRIERLSAVQGQAVGAGQTVGTLSSPDYLAAQSDLVQAVRRALVLAGTADETGARALAEAARQRLLLLGAPERQVRSLLAGGAPSLLLPVPAPVSGTILEVLSQPGMAVEPGVPIYRMANLSVMNVIARVPEQSLPLVRPGAAAEVRVPAYGAMPLSGRVVRILEELDPQTRTARVVVSVPNPGHGLKASMFATVSLATPTGAASLPAEPGISVADGAVMSDGPVRYVFVRVAPRTYEKRVVQIAPAPPGAAAHARTLVVSGLRAGEQVVVTGAFVLRSELAKAGLQDTD